MNKKIKETQRQTDGHLGARAHTHTHTYTHARTHTHTTNRQDLCTDSE